MCPGASSPFCSARWTLCAQWGKGPLSWQERAGQGGARVFLSPLGGGGIGCPAWAAGLKLRREAGLRAGAEGQVLTDEMLVGGRSGSGGRMGS